MLTPIPITKRPYFIPEILSTGRRRSQGRTTTAQAQGPFVRLFGHILAAAVDSIKLPGRWRELGRDLVIQTAVDAP